MKAKLIGRLEVQEKLLSQTKKRVKIPKDCFFHEVEGTVIRDAGKKLMVAIGPSRLIIPRDLVVFL
jgi:hypothetical protein